MATSPPTIDAATKKMRALPAASHAARRRTPGARDLTAPAS
jgi:hypothetical protein